MKNNTLIMMYVANILDGTMKVEDVPSMLREDVMSLAAEYTSDKNNSLKINSMESDK